MNEQSILQYQRKVKTVDELCALIGPRPRQKKVIMCHGTFDIVHPGHVRHLIYAKSKGEILVASVTLFREQAETCSAVAPRMAS